MLCVAAFSGCAGVEDLSGTGGASGSGGVGVVGGGGGSSQSSTLVGQWTRALLVGTPDGDIHESRTTWEFRADHSGIRSVTAWNWTTGVYDTIYDVAQWSTSGSTITIVYIAGTTGTLTLSYRIDGDVLTMGPDQFARVR
jgi:hypothetical protein